MNGIGETRFTFHTEDLEQLARGQVPDWLRFDADTALAVESLVGRLEQIREQRVTGPEKNTVDLCIEAVKETLGSDA